MSLRGEILPRIIRRLVSLPGRISTGVDLLQGGIRCMPSGRSIPFTSRASLRLYGQKAAIAMTSQITRPSMILLKVPRN